MNKTTLLFFLTFLFVLISVVTSYSQNSETEVNFKAYQHVSGYRNKKRKNPQMFQGNKKTENYFEGWYFKMVSQKDSSILSVIPGISLSENGEDQHAFIQVIDGNTAETFYFSFPIEEFYFDRQKFAVRIQDNYFSKDSVLLNLKNATNTIVGKVQMLNQVELIDKKKRAIMGWYRFVPFMECYHGVISLNHNLMGSIEKNGESYNFNKGLGYIEKDWGKSMPSAWIWMQSNHFNSESTSFMLSVANIPWLGSSFIGFLGFFLHKGTVYRFATYTNAKLILDSDNTDTIKITIKENKLTYQIAAFRSQVGVLKAPVQGSMDRRISESIDANLHLRVLDKHDSIIFDDYSAVTGLETVGDMESLKGKKSNMYPLKDLKELKCENMSDASSERKQLKCLGVDVVQDTINYFPENTETFHSKVTTPEMAWEAIKELYPDIEKSKFKCWTEAHGYYIFSFDCGIARNPDKCSFQCSIYVPVGGKEFWYNIPRF